MLRDVRRGRDEEAGGFEYSVGGPGVGTGDGEEDRVLRERGEDFEWFGQFAGSIAGEEMADPALSE